MILLSTHPVPWKATSDDHTGALFARPEGRYTVMLSYSHPVIQLCCHAVTLSYSHAVILSCRHVVMLSCGHVVT